MDDRRDSILSSEGRVSDDGVTTESFGAAVFTDGFCAGVESSSSESSPVSKGLPGGGGTDRAVFDNVNSLEHSESWVML